MFSEWNKHYLIAGISNVSANDKLFFATKYVARLFIFKN